MVGSACGRVDYDPVDRDAHVPDASPIAASFELESGQVIAPFLVVSDALASGGQYVLDNNGVGLTGPGRDVVAFSIPKLASYYIWGRGRSPDTGTDSFFISIDGAAPLPYDTSECIHGTQWHWTVLRLFTANCPMIGAPVAISLDVGGHTLTLTSREGQSALDRIEISEDPTFVPTD
jgi:hypothetical protein